MVTTATKSAGSYLVSKRVGIRLPFPAVKVGIVGYYWPVVFAANLKISTTRQSGLCYISRCFIKKAYRRLVNMVHRLKKLSICMESYSLIHVTLIRSLFGGR